MRVQVECYAGRKAEERPMRFRLGEHTYMVEEVLDSWYGPEHVFFRVRADDGGLYILRHEASVPDGKGSRFRSWSLGSGDDRYPPSGRVISVRRNPDFGHARKVPTSLPHFR